MATLSALLSLQTVYAMQAMQTRRHNGPSILVMPKTRLTKNRSCNGPCSSGLDQVVRLAKPQTELMLSSTLVRGSMFIDKCTSIIKIKRDRNTESDESALQWCASVAQKKLLGKRASERAERRLQLYVPYMIRTNKSPCSTSD
eukprot:TRINITY_DN6267_c0_g2_i2.p1 TRINITY_DN6267_c0_g2~~TRINITY_DN6267_c0_g2_i2.p1  ORF type:complete len:143 (-),score=0.99 TRINITY_DN6267_c0_g2_i2:6-434(-)